MNSRPIGPGRTGSRRGSTRGQIRRRRRARRGRRASEGSRSWRPDGRRPSCCGFMEDGTTHGHLLRSRFGSPSKRGTHKGTLIPFRPAYVLVRGRHQRHRGVPHQPPRTGHPGAGRAAGLGPPHPGIDELPRRSCATAALPCGQPSRRAVHPHPDFRTWWAQHDVATTGPAQAEALDLLASWTATPEQVSTPADR